MSSAHETRVVLDLGPGVLWGEGWGAGKAVRPVGSGVVFGVALVVTPGGPNMPP